MDETDPFGRDKDDDPLADMGWASGGRVKPPDGPADLGTPVPDAAPPAPSSPRPQHRPSPSGIPGMKQRRGGCGCAFVVVVLSFVGAIGIIVVPVVLDAIDIVDQVEDAIPTRPDDPESPGDRRPVRPPSGLDRASLLRRGNLAPALRRLQRITKSTRVRLLRIDAQRVVVQTAAPDGGTRLAQATWDGEASVLSTSPGGGGTTFPWSRVDPSAPNRVVRVTTSGRRASSFDYLVLIDAAGLRWSAFLKNGGGTFQAQPDGRRVTKMG